MIPRLSLLEQELMQRQTPTMRPADQKPRVSAEPEKVDPYAEGVGTRGLEGPSPFSVQQAYELVKGMLGDPDNLNPAEMGAVGAVNIPTSALKELLVETSRKPFKNDYLNMLYRPDLSGSTDVAGTLIGADSIPDPNIIRIKRPLTRDQRIRYNVLADPDYQLKLRGAQEELYAKTQRILERLGAHDPHTKVKAYRHGNLRQHPGVLTPTALQPENVLGFDPQQVIDYNVPRKDIKMLIGLLRRGDDITTTEALVPAGTLWRSFVNQKPMSGLDRWPNPYRRPGTTAPDPAETFFNRVLRERRPQWPSRD